MAKKTLATHEVKFLLSAKNATSKAFKAVQSTLPNIETLALAAGKAVATIGVAASAVATASVIKFKGFESALTDMSRVTNQSLETIKGQVMDLPPSLGDATEMVKGYYNVISAGVTRPVDALDLLTVAAKASKAAHIELDTTVSGITDIMDGFGGSIENAAVASDKLFTIERIGKTRFSELVPVIGQVSSSANLLGASMDELGGLFATVTKTAGGTENAATQVRAVFNSLLKPSSDMSRVLKDLGFDSGRAAIESLGLVETLRSLKDEVDRGNVSFTELFANQRAILGLGPSMLNNFQILEDNIFQMGESAGVTEKAFDDWSGTLEGVWDTFKATIANLAIEFGEVLAPHIKQALEDITFYIQENKAEILDWAHSFGERISEVVQYLSDNKEAIYGWLGGLKEAVISVKEAWIETSEFMKIWAKNFKEHVRPVIDSIVDGIMAAVEALQEFWAWLDKPLFDNPPEWMDHLSTQTDEVIKETERVREEVRKNPIDIDLNTVPAELKAEFIKAMLVNELPKTTTIEVTGESSSALAALDAVTDAQDAMPKQVTVETFVENLEALAALDAVTIAQDEIPKTTTVEVIGENSDALAAIDAVNNGIETIPKEVISTAKVNADPAHTALDSVQRHIAAIPDVIEKTIVMKVVTEASPRMPFTAGMNYIDQKIKDLTDRKTLVIDTELPGGRGAPQILLSPGQIAGRNILNGGGFNQTRSGEATQQTINQNIDINMNITAENLDDKNIDSITDKIASTLARKLRTGRVVEFKAAVRGII